MTTQYTVSSTTTFYQYAKQFFKNPDDVSVIFDVGSLHCLESIKFSKKYKNARIFAFQRCILRTAEALRRGTGTRRGRT